MKTKALISLFLLTLVACLSTAAHAQTYSVIHTFNGADGSQPEAGVTLRAGILYGTTMSGGSFGNVYMLTPSEGNWALSSLFLFKAPEWSPLSRPVFGPDGHLYGTTFFGSGSVFELTPPISICKTANCFWNYEEIDHFQDLQNPGYGDLVFDPQGNIYGTVEFSLVPPQLGAVYQLSHVGNDWVSTPIYRFQKAPNTAQTESGVILDANGNVFGTSPGGGAHNRGSIYELKNVVGVGWQESLIYSFNASSDGWDPTGVTFDSFGNLFGVTNAGGSGNGGTVFELSPSGDTWTFKVLYSFTDPGNCNGFGGPVRPLTIDTAGNLYGTTNCVGAYGYGSVFKLTKGGSTWVYSSLYDFTGGADGANPASTVTIDADGTLYGTASRGGSQNSNGVVWMIKP